MTSLVGTASDEVPEILATGHTDITTLYTSFSSKHLDGDDASYLEWHTLDHRPEQQRLKELRTSFRMVSTPSCRAARLVSAERFDATDHLQTYFFQDLGAMDGFNELSIGLRNAGRTPYLLPTVERAVYRLSGMAAAPRIKAGADVLPWWPTKGIFLLVEQGEASGASLVEVPGVGGVWWAAADPMDPPFATRDNSGLQITYCFLDDEPPEVAARLQGALERRWSEEDLEPLLAAPFYGVVPYEWDRYLP